MFRKKTHLPSLFPQDGNRGLVTLVEKRRLTVLAVFLFLLFCLIIVQFYKIQIVEGEKWTKKARAQHVFTVKEPFKRGLFYSNTAVTSSQMEYKQPLVFDVPAFHLYIDPKRIPPQLRLQIAQALFQALQVSEGDKRQILQQFQKQSHSRKIASWLSKEKRDAISTWWTAFARANKVERNALYFEHDYKRSYPFGHLLGSVLHTVRDLRDPQSGQNIPTGGLELIFNKVLQGREGKRELLRSPRSPMDMGKVISHPEDGADVYLTINHLLQAICEEEIAKGVKLANAKGGWAVLMKPRTGEILALAQYPFFDPRNYRDYFNDQEKSEATKVKAVADVFEPGSTMKPLTVTIALMANDELERRGEKPLFSPYEKIDTRPCILPGRNKPMKDLRVHNCLNMYLALQKSSNVYMAKLAQRIIERLGDQWYRDALKNLFGFGEQTGIELPSESSGLLPTPGKLHPNGTLEWSAPTPYSLAMGHNLLVNSVQMMLPFASLANGGYAVKPTIIRKVVKTHSNGSEEVLVDNTKPERVASFPKVLPAKVVKQVNEALRAITKPGGTSPRGDIFGYTEIGKSGTSEKIINGQYSKKTNFSSFIGFAPAENAEFVLFVGIDEPEWKFIPHFGKMHMGGNCAAMTFREIGLRVLQFLGVEPDDPYGYPVNDPRYDREKANWMPEVKALKTLYEQWNG